MCNHKSWIYKGTPIVLDSYWSWMQVLGSVWILMRGIIHSLQNIFILISHKSFQIGYELKKHEYNLCVRAQGHKL